MTTIRPAIVWDAKEITDLWYEMYREITTNRALLLETGNKENLFINVVTRLKLPEWCVLVAEEHGQIYGFMMATICFPRYNPCYILGVVEAIYVDPTRRGEGLFQKMIGKMYEWGETKNVKHVEFVSMRDPRIEKLYDCLGYEPVQVTYRKKEV